MVHFVREHDPKPEPVQLHEDHAMDIQMIRASLSDLHRKFDTLIDAFETVAAKKDSD
jgi:tRNA A-37 threonylcarbamoyl transferase component Bud32